MGTPRNHGEESRESRPRTCSPWLLADLQHKRPPNPKTVLSKPSDSLWKPTEKCRGQWQLLVHGHESYSSSGSRPQEAAPQQTHQYHEKGTGAGREARVLAATVGCQLLNFLYHSLFLPTVSHAPSRRTALGTHLLSSG